MSEHVLRLLALDGGGIRGLSMLEILKQLMSTINQESPPKPCDCFDMIGGTSTGGSVFITLQDIRLKRVQANSDYAWSAADDSR